MGIEQNYRRDNLKNGAFTMPFYKALLPRDLQEVLVNLKTIKKYDLDISKIIEKYFPFDFCMKGNPIQFDESKLCKAKI